jgi:predicted acyl esterase
MTVGGWFDAEDLRGASYLQNHRKTSPKAKNTIVMGPFSHGGWSHEMGKHFHNEIYFGDSIATFYQKNIETPFFNHYLKNPKSAIIFLKLICLILAKKSGNNLQNGHQKQLKKLSFI